MNTLNRQITRTFFVDKDNGFENLKARWSQIVNDKETRKSLTAEHYALYAALRGKDWRKGLTLPTNSNKLNNGYQSKALQIAKHLHSGWWSDMLIQPFEGIIDLDGLKALRVSPGNSVAGAATSRLR